MRDLKSYINLYFVRHGLTEWNIAKRYLGWTDLSLLESEKHQLDILKNMLSDIHFDCCYSSDLLRCQETLTYIVPSHEGILDYRLRELNFGDWEGLTYDMLKTSQLYQEWLSNWETVSPSKGETGKEFKSRLNAFLTDLIKSSSPKESPYNILIVTHGGVIRYFLSLFVEELSFWEIPIKHSSGYVLSLEINNREGLPSAHVRGYRPIEES